MLGDELVVDFPFQKSSWLNKPKSFQLDDNKLVIKTDAETDFWQRTFYGFRNKNAPAVLHEIDINFTFTCKVSFEYSARFDQCGVILFIDDENWFKASIEYENGEFSRLGSVVTNLGYSDWATQDIELPPHIWYRLHRRGPDFLIEVSTDGKRFEQMRVFHMHKLGETTAQMGKVNLPLEATQSVKIGLYACSPTNSSFEAHFEQCTITKTKWTSHFT